MFRKRRAPDPYAEQIREAFTVVAVHVERAQRALLAAVPKPRDDGAPLAQALSAFAKVLGEARDAMPRWRHHAVEQLWVGCEAALDEARLAADRLRMNPGPLSFEALNEAIGDVLAPLEAFVDADRALRRI